MQIRRALALVVGTIGAFTVCLAEGENMSHQDTSVVIVHGAFTNGSDWNPVIERLQARGIRVHAVHNGLKSLAEDVAATRRTINAQAGKVVLVGHSWGGMVITEAGQNDKVAALVYVAAFVPSAGQSLGDLGKNYPPSPGNASLVADAEGYLSLPPEAIASAFAQDLPERQTALLAAVQGPIQSTALGEPVKLAAWNSKPSWYVVSENDRMIQPDMERAMAKAIGARVTSLPTSHVPQLSRPDAVANVIIEAVAQSQK